MSENLSHGGDPQTLVVFVVNVTVALAASAAVVSFVVVNNTLIYLFALLSYENVPSCVDRS